MIYWAIGPKLKIIHLPLLADRQRCVSAHQGSMLSLKRMELSARASWPQEPLWNSTRITEECADSPPGTVLCWCHPVGREQVLCLTVWAWGVISGLLLRGTPEILGSPLALSVCLFVFHCGPQTFYPSRLPFLPGSYSVGSRWHYTC